MKITINGSAKELTELAIALSYMENEEKKPYFPPLLTKLAEDEKINELAENIQPALDKMNKRAKQDKENAPQAETAEQKKNQEILEKQMKLLSEASEFCAGDLHFSQNLSKLTRAMIDLNQYQGGLS